MDPEIENDRLPGRVILPEAGFLRTGRDIREGERNGAFSTRAPEGRNSR